MVPGGSAAAAASAPLQAAQQDELHQLAADGEPHPLCTHAHKLTSRPMVAVQSCDHTYPLQEFFHYSMGTVLIFIASVVAAVKSGGVSALVVASVRSHALTWRGNQHTELFLLIPA